MYSAKALMMLPACSAVFVRFGTKCGWGNGHLRVGSWMAAFKPDPVSEAELTLHSGADNNLIHINIGWLLDREAISPCILSTASSLSITSIFKPLSLFQNSIARDPHRN
jgi:hypothetical protein